MDNIVTIGTTLMANTSDSYASFAVLMYQSFGRKVCRHLAWAQRSKCMPPALDQQSTALHRSTRLCPAMHSPALHCTDRYMWSA